MPHAIIELVRHVDTGGPGPFGEDPAVIEHGFVTADLHVRYLGRPHGDTVYARGEVLKAGRQLIVVECRVTDTENRVIASADFSMMIVPLRKPLRPMAGAKDTDPDL